MPDPSPQARAMDLLLSVLPEPERRTLEEVGSLTIRGSAGGRYQLTIGRSGNVVRVDEQGNPAERMCIHPREPVPDEDTVLTQVLMLWTNEPGFLALANRTRLGAQPDLTANQWLCATVRDFCAQLVGRRQQGHPLVPHDDPYRLYRGFQDMTTHEWIVIRIRHLRDVTEEDAAQLGMSLDSLRLAFGHWREFARMLGYDDGMEQIRQDYNDDARFQLIGQSLETMRGRQALAASLMARLQHGGPLTHEVHTEVVRIWEQLLEHAEVPDESEELVNLTQWLDEDNLVFAEDEVLEVVREA